MRTVRLEISPTPAHVRTARLVAVAVARQCGVSEALLDEIRLAVGEACSRAVGLHRVHAPTALVAIEFFDELRFGVAVRDCAPPELAMADATPDPFALLHASAPAPAASGAEEQGSASGAGQSGGASEPFAEEAIAAGVGLALLAGLVDDLQVGPAPDGTGSIVRMSWPIG